MDQTQADTHPRQKSWSWVPWAIVGALLVVLTYVAFGIVIVTSLFWPNPEFPSLALTPDPSLSGTVAYFDDESLCVHVVAAAGQPNKQVYCLEQDQPADPITEGKNVGVDIAWLPDDRLELTLYRMKESKDPGPPTFFPAWQRIVDVRTGEVEEVPPSQYAGRIPSRTCLKRSPSGEELVTSSENDHATVTLVSAAGERTLLDVRGNPETYRLDQACWAPNYQWAYTSDTRLLVITTGDEPVTRTLTPPMTTFYGYDVLSWYAVTASNVLAK
ncbi:MAG: hypothetical protein ACR2KE_05365 [Candidatus Nanopelagicales bacterium]